jgi:hypothetical protein
MAARISKRLPFRKLWELACAVAEAHCLSMPSSYRLRLFCTDREPIPTVTVNEHGTLWIDREYVAYALTDEAVRYVYVTRSHARAEIASYAILRKGPDKRDNPPKLPLVILNQFRTALRMMNLRNSRFYLFKEVRRLPLPWDRDEKNFGHSRKVE